VRPINGDATGLQRVSEVSTRARLSIIGVVVAALFGGLLARLWFLQVGSPNTYSAQTQANRLRTVVDPGVRGSIVDVHGNPLVSNRLVNTIEIQRGLKTAQLNKTVPPAQTAERLVDQGKRFAALVIVLHCVATSRGLFADLSQVMSAIVVHHSSLAPLRASRSDRFQLELRLVRARKAVATALVTGSKAAPTSADACR
jgi:cell division protein FtsI/penicillin-binding protein 2